MYKWTLYSCTHTQLRVAWHLRGAYIWKFYVFVLWNPSKVWGNWFNYLKIGFRIVTTLKIDEDLGGILGCIFAWKNGKSVYLMWTFDDPFIEKAFCKHAKALDHTFSSCNDLEWFSTKSVNLLRSWWKKSLFFIWKSFFGVYLKFAWLKTSKNSTSRIFSRKTLTTRHENFRTFWML